MENGNFVKGTIVEFQLVFALRNLPATKKEPLDDYSHLLWIVAVHSQRWAYLLQCCYYVGTLFEKR